MDRLRIKSVPDDHVQGGNQDEGFHLQGGSFIKPNPHTAGSGEVHGQVSAKRGDHHAATRPALPPNNRVLKLHGVLQKVHS